MTQRLYYNDSYLSEFDARIVDRSGDGMRVYLDRSAFYPSSGGQPFDRGEIDGAPVLDVIEEADRVAHVLAAPVLSEEVHCRIDWPRRFDHMQQHSGQHLLSAVFAETVMLHTVSFHLGQESSTIDLDTLALDSGILQSVERRANETIFENRPVTVQFAGPGESGDLRKPSERTGVLRIVSIEGLDRSACGGTHVRSTGEIGVILIRKVEKVRDATRVEFLCGARAVRRARADFEALSNIARMFSAPLDETPGMAAAHLEAARAGEKLLRKLEADLARYRGRELYEGTAPDPAGFRRAVRTLRDGNLEELRPLAQSFTEQPKAIFIGALQQPPSILLAVSADAGIDAGKAMKSALAQVGGRGGGNSRMAQGSVSSADLLERVAGELAR